MTASSIPAIPVHILTGALGAGKTTAIARLLADKPPAESWLVILNEFTDTGIDTLTLASAARGAYDLRMIPGGCLCCTGEEDFRQQLARLLAQPREHWPARILIEPSGIAHPGMIVEELRGYERSGMLKLRSVIALLDAQSWQGAADLSALVAEQVGAADVVLLSKAELVGETAWQSFYQWANGLFPAKRYIGRSQAGELPPEALAPPPAQFSFVPREWAVRPALHAHEHAAHQHVHAPEIIRQPLRWCGQPVLAQTQRLLAREACGWRIPGALLFDRQALQALLVEDSVWQGVERFKAVLRTGVDEWYLLQRWSGQHSMVVSAWHQDSRIELQLMQDVRSDWPRWHDRWEAVCELCPVS